MSRRLISISQLCDETGIASRQLAEDAADGALPAHRVAGRWVIDRDEIAQYLDAADSEDDDEDDEGDEDDDEDE